MQTPEIFPPAENPLSSKLAAFAKEYGEKAHVGLIEALRQVCLLNPGLAAAAREEVLHTKQTVHTIDTDSGPFQMVVTAASEQFSALVDARRIAKGVPHCQAYKEVRAENPALWQSAREEVLGEKP